MHRLPVSGLACLLAIAAVRMSSHGFAAQEPEKQPVQPVQSGQAAEEAAQKASQQPIGRVSAAEARVSGAVEIGQGEMLVGNGSTVTAADRAVKIALARGGQLLLCSTTSLHLSQDRSAGGPKSTALMMALDRGALETNYAVGKYSDVLLTPDLRILISGPGQAELSVRVNMQGDTCVDNHGGAAPYVLVSSQLDGGAYRVMPNQRVTFEHGSLRDVVDREAEPCGCPPAISLADAGVSAENPAHPGTPVGGPSSTPSDTAFPIAESEGLAPPPTPTKPVVPAGQTDAEVSVPLTYSGENPAVIPAAKGNQGGASIPGLPEITPGAAGASAAAGATAQPPAPKKNGRGGFFHRIGHFFSRLML